MDNLVTTDYTNPETPYRVRLMEELKPLHSWRFETEEECLLAISLWLATPVGTRDVFHFSHTFKNVLRMIGCNTSWSH